MHYKAAATETLIAIPLGELTALYHRASGQTHVVAEPAPQILQALAAPMTSEQLLDHLGSHDVEALAARLAELEAIGLITSS